MVNRRNGERRKSGNEVRLKHFTALVRFGSTRKDASSFATRVLQDDKASLITITESCAGGMLTVTVWYTSPVELH